MSAVSAAVRGVFLRVVTGAALLSAFAWADQPSIRHIGVMTGGTWSSVEEGLRDGLHELGYIDGKSIVIEWRRSLGTDKELRSLASELASAKVELIVVFSTPAARAVLQTTTVPVVFGVGDPVGSGLAGSVAHPGGRSTGVSMLMHRDGQQARAVAAASRAGHPPYRLSDEFLQPAECTNAGRGTERRSNT